jgi:hypothetical protein
MNHLTPEQIDSYRTESLSAEERRQAAVHLADCDVCFFHFKTVPTAAIIGLATTRAADELEVADEHLAFEEIQEYIDGEASAVLVEIIQVHVESCEFCRVRVDDLCAFKAEVERSLPSSSVLVQAFPADTPASDLAPVSSEVVMSWRTRAHTLLAARRTSKLRTGWLTGAFMAGIAAALWIVLSRSGPKSVSSSDAANAKLTRQTGYMGKEREEALRKLESAKQPVQDWKARAQTHVATAGQGPGLEAGYTGVNTTQTSASAHKAGGHKYKPGMNTHRMAVNIRDRAPAATREPSEHNRALPLSPPTVRLNHVPTVIDKAPNKYGNQALSPSKFNSAPAVVDNGHNRALRPPIPPPLLPADTHRDTHVAPGIAQAPAVLPQPPSHREPPIEPPVVVRNDRVRNNIGAAQAPVRRQHEGEAATQQTREPSSYEPFFYKELTRESLGNIQNLDAQNVAEGRMAPDGHMIITGANTEVYVPPGKYVEMVPNINIPGFLPVVLNILEDGIRTQSYGLELAGDLPPLRIDRPVGGSNRKRVSVVVYDGQNHSRLLMQCVMRARIANANVADLDLKRGKEQCSLNIKDNQTLTVRHLYLGDICLGRMEDKAGKIDMDERRLAPGKYTCQLIAKNEDGILLPGPSSEFVVPARYTITPTNTDAKIVIPEENLDATLEVTVTHRPNLDITKTQVYIAGIFAGEKEGDDFKIALPLKSVPTGKTSIEVIGVASDGVAYPVENIVVDLNNGAWFARIQNTAEWQRIQDNKAQIKTLNVDMHDWLKQAEFEPELRHTKTVYTLKSITEHYAAGKKGEYMGKAARCLTQMADLQYEAGQFYKKLQMKILAKNMFYTVTRELGTDSINGEKAQTALIALTKTQ